MRHDILAFFRFLSYILKQLRSLIDPYTPRDKQISFGNLFIPEWFNLEAIFDIRHI